MPGRREPDPRMLKGIERRLKSARIRNGKSQAWLGLRLGITRTGVHKIEAGSRVVSFADAVRWCRATGESLDILAAFVTDLEPSDSCPRCGDEPPPGFMCEACQASG